MNCEKCLYLIDDLIEGELDELFAAQIEQHIDACSDCRAEFEIARREKALFADFMFAAEPSENLRTNFYARLEAENQSAPAVKISERASDWKTRIFSFLHFSPALAGAALIIVCGLIFGLTKLVSNEKTGADNIVADAKTTDFQLPPNNEKPVAENAAKNIAQKPEIIKVAKTPKLNDAKNERDKRLREKISLAKTPELRRAPNGKSVRKLEDNRIFNRSAAELNNQIAQLSEEEKQRRALLIALETEATRQIEKVELLLRSFRNARSAADGDAEFFDVAYERQQARKLLEKNVRLRREAENLGTIYAEELLGKVEPLLLDIANLEKNAAPERVRDIKERVSNQNIIASLQIY